MNNTNEHPHRKNETSGKKQKHDDDKNKTERNGTKHDKHRNDTHQNETNSTNSTKRPSKNKLVDLTTAEYSA